MITDSLFIPGRIGNLEIKNKIFMSPMSVHLVAMDGSVTQVLLDYFEERAKGGVGLIITGATHAEMEVAQGSITGCNLRIDDNKYVIGLSELTDIVHRHGTKIFVQLSIGQGSLCPPFLYPKGVQPPAPSSVENPFAPGWKPRELTEDEIRRIVESYGEASFRAKMAGFDGIEIHGHGMYLLSQFMSPYTNKRKDRYGEPAVLPLELIKSVREHSGEDFPISFRWNIDEFLEGGRDLEMSRKDAAAFEQAGINSINISGGNFWIPGAAAHSCPPMSYPEGHLRQLAKSMKDTVKIPVMLSSKIAEPFVACQILQRGEADFIGLGRGLLADPEWPNKVAQGQLDAIRPCIRDMDGCINRVVKFARISCSVNAACGREDKSKIEPTSRPVKVIVVGGGIAGMEAARVAALRGNEVTLFERSSSLGGQAKLASTIPYKEDIARFIDYLETQVQKAGVTLKTGVEATPQLLLSMQPEAVIIATGAKHMLPNIPGINKPSVLFARDVVAEKCDLDGKCYVVAGGGYIGLDTAVYLAVKKRKSVTIVEQLTLEEVGFEPYDMNYMDTMRLLTENGAQIMTEMTIKEITQKEVTVEDKEGKRQQVCADGVVVALGSVADAGLAEALNGKVRKLHKIGDCNCPGKIRQAVHEGFYVGSIV